MSKTFAIYVGVDGGATSTKVAITTNNNELLAIHKGESSNNNNIGFYQACQNVFNAIKDAISLADKSFQSNKPSDTTTTKLDLSNIRGICFSLAGVDRIRDKENWYNAVCVFFKKEFAKMNETSTDNEFRVPLIHIYNDAIASAMAYNPDNIEGIVCIIGTGSIVCGFKNNETNDQHRSGGWGPVFGDPCSGYAMGMTVLRNCAVYHDIINNYTNEQIINEKIKEANVSKFIHDTVLRLAKVDKFDEMLDWAYKGIESNKVTTTTSTGNDDEKEDNNNSNDNNGFLHGFKIGGKDVYERIASLAPIAIYGSDEDSVCFDIVSDAIKGIIKDITIVMDRVYPKEYVLEQISKNNKFVINIICGGSILLKCDDDKFLNMLQKLLCYELGGDSRQAFISFVKPQLDAEIGAARFIRNCYKNGIKQNRNANSSQGAQ